MDSSLLFVYYLRRKEYMRIVFISDNPYFSEICASLILRIFPTHMFKTVSVQLNFDDAEKATELGAFEIIDMSGVLHEIVWRTPWSFGRVNCDIRFWPRMVMCAFIRDAIDHVSRVGGNSPDECRIRALHVAHLQKMLSDYSELSLKPRV